MKRFYTALAVGALALSSTVSADKLPIIYSANFDNDGVFEQWTQYGSGRKLVDNTQVQGIWGALNATPYQLILAGEQGWAASTSNFVDISKEKPADEWLVSPSFKMPYDGAVLTYKAFATNVSSLEVEDNQFAVKVSDKGNAKPDFQEENISVGELKLQSRTFSAVLNGFKDKDLNLAFINISQNPGVVGFNNIDVMQYYVNVVDNTPKFIQSQSNVSLTVRIRTPKACNGFKAILKSSTGVEDVFECTQELSEYINTVEVKFEKPLVLTDEVLDATYTVTIVPNFEGALESEINGGVHNSVLYTKKVVVEEGTSTGCGYCPRGAVALDMWHKEYGMRVIPIAVHSNMTNVTDPMVINGGAYLRGLGISGLPGGRYNRKPNVTAGFMSPDEIKPYLEEIATADAHFKVVNYDPTTRRFEVNYLARMGYANNETSLSMAAVLVEDNVSGTATNYKQSNYYSRTPKENLVAQYGEDWWPAWQKFAEGPSYISAKNMVYNHVARGIFPSFKGQKVSSEWERNTDISGTISFDMPASVLDETQTMVVIILTDDATGEIVGADYVTYQHYNELYAGIDNTEAEENVAVVREGNVIRVNAAEGAAVEVFAVDGSLLARRVMNGQETEIDANGFSGIVIVKVSNGKTNVTRKLAF